MRRLTTVVACLLGALMGAGPAGAQDAEAPQRLGFGVRPLDSAGGNFELRGKPGSTVGGTLLVSNPTGSPVKVLLRVQDVGTALVGGLEYTDPKPGGVGEWLRLGADSVRLAPHTARRVSVRADIPVGVRAGDHIGGIVAYNAAELRRSKKQPSARGAVNMRFVSRFGIAVGVRVRGPAGARLGFDGLKIVSNPSGAAINVGLTNPGELLVPTSTGRITVTKDGKVLLEEPISLAAFVPGTRIDYSLPWNGTPAEGTYRVEGFVHPAEGQAVAFDEQIEFGGRQTDTFERQTGLQVTATAGGTAPWVWLLIGVLGLAVLVLSRLAYRAGLFAR
jgi:hypothetical protein